MILQVGVKAVVKNKENKYLLTKRSSKKYPEVAGTWDIIGGRINPGTPLMENLKREIKEETNLDLIGEPQLIMAQDILSKPDHHIVRLTYRAQVEGELYLDPEEAEEFKWFTLEEIKKINLDDKCQELLDKGFFT